MFWRVCFDMREASNPPAAEGTRATRRVQYLPRCEAQCIMILNVNTYPEQRRQIQCYHCALYATAPHEAI